MKTNLLYWVFLLVSSLIVFSPMIFVEDLYPGNKPMLLLSFVWFFLIAVIHLAIVPKIIRCSSCEEPLLPYSTIWSIKFLNRASFIVPIECKKCGCKTK